MPVAQNALTAVVLLSLCLGFQQFTDPIYWAATTAVAGRFTAACFAALGEVLWLWIRAEGGSRTAIRRLAGW